MVKERDSYHCVHGWNCIFTQANTNGFIGKAPDIGAEKHGGEWWQAGCEGHIRPGIRLGTSRQALPSAGVPKGCLETHGTKGMSSFYNCIKNDALETSP